MVLGWSAFESGGVVVCQVLTIRLSTLAQARESSSPPSCIPPEVSRFGEVLCERCVVADSERVGRPLGTTMFDRTRTGFLLGTEGSTVLLHNSLLRECSLVGC